MQHVPVNEKLLPNPLTFFLRIYNTRKYTRSRLAESILFRRLEFLNSEIINIIDINLHIRRQQNDSKISHFQFRKSQNIENPRNYSALGTKGKISHQSFKISIREYIYI
jgi:hypothetical protein